MSQKRRRPPNWSRRRFQISSLFDYDNPEDSPAPRKIQPRPALLRRRYRHRQKFIAVFLGEGEVVRYV